MAHTPPASHGSAAWASSSKAMQAMNTVFTPPGVRAPNIPGSISTNDPAITGR
ncbi:hypothetical protein D3C83_268070 [compost metagenome]